MQRELAALRAIEAIRHYAAGHDGKLPGKLTDVTDLPMPTNPVTGEPFVYRGEGETGILEDDGAGPFNRRYRLRMAK